MNITNVNVRQNEKGYSNTIVIIEFFYNILFQSVNKTVIGKLIFNKISNR